MPNTTIMNKKLSPINYSLIFLWYGRNGIDIDWQWRDVIHLMYGKSIHLKSGRKVYYIQKFQPFFFSRQNSLNFLPLSLCRAQTQPGKLGKKNLFAEFPGKKP